MIQEQANFRILALTATPGTRLNIHFSVGSDIKTVSKVVENLRISKIEIRTEDSMDIIPFIHKRSLDLVVVPLSEAIQKLSTCYATIMSVFLKRLNDQKVHHEKDPLNVTSYILLKSRERFRMDKGSRPQSTVAYIEGTFGIAMVLASAYTLLIQHGIHTFYNSCERFRTETLAKGSKASKASGELLRHPQFLYILNQLPNSMKLPGYSSHPKMEKLVQVILDHFLEHSSTESDQTRVIVFSQFRESVEEIVQMLGRHHPIIRVMSFIGQSSGAKGKKGFTQKEQLEVRAF